MRIDRKARRWIIVFSVLFVFTIVGFCFYRRAWGVHRTGGTWPGLGFGAAGFLSMIIAWLLALRKAARKHLLGKVATWMQAHVWFGILSYPLILCHANNFYPWGGTLTTIIMWLFTVVWVSGIVGLIIQNVVPPRLAREVPAETIGAQIGHVQKILRDEAATVFRVARAGGESVQSEEEEEEGASTAVAVRPVAVNYEPFTRFYDEKIVPFLDDRFNKKSPLASPTISQAQFESLRERIDRSLHPALARLESLVDERRQLAQQRRLHGWLYWWLVFHVPASYVLILLAGFHTFKALQFMTTK